MKLTEKKLLESFILVSALVIIVLRVAVPSFKVAGDLSGWTVLPAGLLCMMAVEHPAFSRGRINKKNILPLRVILPNIIFFLAGLNNVFSLFPICMTAGLATTIIIYKYSLSVRPLRIRVEE